MSRILNHPLFIAFCTLITVVLCTSLYINSRKIRQTSQVITSLQGDLEKTSTDVKNAQSALDDAQDPFTKEKIIRDQLLLQKPGEYIVQIPEEPVASKAAVESSPSPTAWEQWRELLSF